MLQYDTTHRSNAMTDLITRAGATAYLLLYTAAAANCAAAAAGTLVASLPCSATFGVNASGVLTANAITSATATAGTALQWRLCTSAAGTTCIAQGNVYTQSTAVTNAASAAGLATLSFASAPSVVNGQTVTGTNIPAGTYVISGGGTATLTLSNAIATGGVASGATITFGGDISFNQATFGAGQTVSVSSFVLTATGA